MSVARFSRHESAFERNSCPCLLRNSPNRCVVIGLYWLALRTTPRAPSTLVARSNRSDQLLFWLKDVVVKTTSPGGRLGFVTREAHSRAAITDLPEPGGPLMMMTLLGAICAAGERNSLLMIPQDTAKAFRWLSSNSNTLALGFKIWAPICAT